MLKIFLIFRNWISGAGFLGSVEIQIGQICHSTAGIYPGLKACTSILCLRIKGQKTRRFFCFMGLKQSFLEPNRLPARRAYASERILNVQRASILSQLAANVLLLRLAFNFEN
jgi:hypothetical protein